MSSTNALVRGEAMNFYKTAHTLLKDEINPFIQALKPAQQEELKKFLSGQSPAKRKGSEKEGRKSGSRAEEEAGNNNASSSNPFSRANTAPDDPGNSSIIAPNSGKAASRHRRVQNHYHATDDARQVRSRR